MASSSLYPLGCPLDSGGTLHDRVSRGTAGILLGLSLSYEYADSPHASGLHRRIRACRLDRHCLLSVL